MNDGLLIEVRKRCIYLTKLNSKNEYIKNPGVIN